VVLKKKRYTGMKDVFLKDIKERDRVEGIFLVSKKDMPISKSGKPYLSLKLMDKTGEMEGRVWDNAEKLSQNFGKNDFIQIKGWAVLYQNVVQLNVSSIKRCPEEEVDLENFLPTAARSGDEMLQDLTSIINNMNDGYLRELLMLFVNDEEIRNLWKKAPAAKGMHHAYLGGLLEHSLSLSKLVLNVVKHYNSENSDCLDKDAREEDSPIPCGGINEDILLSGAVLHDIGKIYELSYNKSFDYTDEGRLLGHITIGIGMLEKKVSQIPGFPRELATLLKHLILSHHGQLEFGSPKRPKTVEAIMLSYLDDMDSKIQSVQSLIKKDNSDSNWTGYHRLYERCIYKGSPTGITPVESSFGNDHHEAIFENEEKEIATDKLLGKEQISKEDF
jgi:3'-5' exoribonuclease